MSFFDMNNFLLHSTKLAVSDTDSLASTEIRDRALSNSSVGSQDYLPSSNTSYYGQSNLKDLNLLLALLTQNQQTQQQQQQQQHQYQSQIQTNQSYLIEKGRSNSDASQSAEDFKGLFDLNSFSLFPQSQFERKISGQVFIPKPIRSMQSKQNSMLQDLGIDSTNSNSSPQQQQSNVKNLILEASLNIFQNLMRKETGSEVNVQNNSQTQQVPSPMQSSVSSQNQPQQSQIMYQPNIIFGVQLTPEEMQKRRELRRQKIEKYLIKKLTRKWDVLRYEVRKKIAKTRQRVKGRFVKEEKKMDSDDSQVSNPQIKSINSTQIVLSDDQMNSMDNM
ncbi:CCT motif protein (macronuclear) [Tetrahymena thermophila SB210]|uniref:CCT motif protein n=1 Tax=Tetrahymena thermophila (strain SB210) TaxID=312017 RepID=Q23TX3_TETTS|nr:CCT motif protein [Tetrahymena thermophila SB210]EAS00008.1 CCT motif protein [Tetrahymena thermophila SB210]|eukprot:XP_001020253.1 CCT motif protein [Tetrahymena thermophila SB210]